MFLHFCLIFSFLFSFNSACALETIIDRPAAAAKGLVVIAPAKKYLMRERLFSELAEKLKLAGYTIVRFNWAADTLQIPEQELTRAARDLKAVMKAAQQFTGIPASRTVLVSKSFSTIAILPSVSLARLHVLLTPNCSIEAPFQSTYGPILSRRDIVLRMIISAEDPYCNVEDIRQTLRPISKLHWLGVTHGDHNFVVSPPGATVADFRYQDQVVRNIVNQVRLNLPLQ